MGQISYECAFWTMILRDVSVTAVTFYHCVKISQREKRKLIYLQEQALPSTHLIDLQIVFDSVMPRAYFIKYLNEKAQNDHNGVWVIDCVDIYQEFQLLLNSLDAIQLKLKTLSMVEDKGPDFTQVQDVTRLLPLVDLKGDDLSNDILMLQNSARTSYLTIIEIIKNNLDLFRTEVD